jgi:hypothetical protein
MILKKNKYGIFLRDEKFWTLKPIEIEWGDLFVVKNAIGKTISLQDINRLGPLILDNGFTSNTNYSVELSEGTDTYQYVLNVESMKQHRVGGRNNDPR